MRQNPNPYFSKPYPEGGKRTCLKTCNQTPSFSPLPLVAWYSVDGPSTFSRPNSGGPSHEVLPLCVWHARLCRSCQAWEMEKSTATTTSCQRSVRRWAPPTCNYTSRVRLVAVTTSQIVAQSYTIQRTGLAGGFLLYHLPEQVPELGFQTQTDRV